MKSFPLLNTQEQAMLEDTLYYLKMVELKKACAMLALPESGKKLELINRIITFVQSGTIVQTPRIPVQSRAINHSPQPLAPKSLMLYGLYKNDAQARTFFKQLIGQHFHFTAFGIDWLNERWLTGNPPTYQEFADFWIAETARRKQEKPAPKDEWMFIRFMQDMEHKYPDASKQELMHAWQQTQAEKAETVFLLLIKLST